MDRFFKYKRITKTIECNNEEVQKFFDELVSNGWEIIYYNEIRRDELFQNKINKSESIQDSYELINYYKSYIDVTIIAGKRQSNIL